MKNLNRKQIALMGLPVTICLLIFGLGACRGHGQGFLTLERIRTIIDWKTNDFMDKINATPTQRQQIETLKNSIMQEAVVLHTQIHSQHGFFLDQWRQEDPDSKAIHAEIDRQADLKREFAHKITDTVIELHDILTPEQRNLLAEHIEALHRHHHSLNSK